jgi:hypothetical protein
MTASTATADTPLRQAWMPVFRIQAGRLAARSVDILFQVCLPSSRLRVPVSHGVLAVSSRTVMNNVGSESRRFGGTSTKEVIVTRAFLFGIAMIAVGLVSSPNVVLADEDDGSKISITSPKNGDKVGDTFDLKYKLVKGSKAAHAHVYLDGQPQKKFPGTFKGVSRGKHEIKVQAATHDHDHLAASDAITVEVQ